VPPDHAVTARVVAKEGAVLCGQAWFERCIQTLDPTATFHWLCDEGSVARAGNEICLIHGNARALLSAERPALNFLQMLSAVSTLTRQYVEAIAGVSPNPRGCQVLDTRKTLPGLRQAQKYAVRVGGGHNQRMALWDGILIKENHIAAAGGIGQAIRAALALNAAVTVQVEVEDLAELEQALGAGAQHVLLDDFSWADMRQAVSQNAGRAELEASGGVDLSTIRHIASTGVDRISVGKLTKDVKAIDLSMRIEA
jgi:nicotinate-nucleotide pyrophosphorylase (carboxylating)